MNRETLQAGGLLLNVKHLPDRDLAQLAATHGSDLDELIGIVKWKRTDEQCIDKAEDRGIRADGQSERQNNRHGESRTPADLPETEAQIADESFHKYALARLQLIARKAIGPSNNAPAGTLASPVGGSERRAAAQQDPQDRRDEIGGRNDAANAVASHPEK
jgi:hypothetical protein